MKKIIKRNIKKLGTFNISRLTLFFLIGFFVSTTNLLALMTGIIGGTGNNNTISSDDTLKKIIETFATKEEVKKTDGKVEENKKNITENKTKIDKNKSDIQSNKNAVDQNKTNIQTNKQDITENKAQIDQNKTAIADNKQKIENNTNTIVQNKSDIQNNKNKIEIIEKDLLNKGSVTSKTLTLTNNKGRIFAGVDLTIELKEKSIEEKHLSAPLKNKIDSFVTKEENKKLITELSDVAVKYDDKAKQQITLGHTPVSLKNVKDGTDKNDAVNYGQLKDIVNGEIKEGETRGVSGDKIYKEFEKVRMGHTKQLSGGIATAMAMSGIPQVGDNKLFSIGFGTAYYNKQGGFAVGISGTEKTNTFIYKISAGMDTQKTFGVSAGFNLNFVDNIKSKTVSINSTYGSNAVQDKLDELQKEIAKLKELQKDVEMLKQVKTSNRSIYFVSHFSRNSKDLTSQQRAIIKDIIKELNSKYLGTTLDITGYADTTGSYNYNLELGLERAMSVTKVLYELGLDKSIKIGKVSSSGSNNVVDSGIKEENRRVEISVR